MSNTITIRPLEVGDFSCGFLDVVEDFAGSSPLLWNSEKTGPSQLCLDTFAHIHYNVPTQTPHIVLVAIDKNVERVVGMGALVVQQKFIHDASKSATIEEVSVLKPYRGQGIGRQIITALKEVAADLSVYKVNLLCSNYNVAFYEKMGFRHSSNGMRIDMYKKENGD